MKRYRYLLMGLVLSGCILAAGAAAPVPSGPAPSAAESETSPEAPSFAEALAELRKLQADKRRLPEAESEAKRLVALALERHGADSPEAVEVRGLLGRILIDQGKKRAPEAVAVAQEALASAERLWSKDDLRLRQPLKDLGNALEFRGAFVESKAVRLRLLDICEAHADPMDGCTGDALADLGLISRQLGNYAESRVYSERALAAHERRSKTDSRSDIAGVLYLLSAVCRQEGDLDQAMAHAERGVRLMEEAPTGMLYMMLTQLAGIYRELGRYEESRDVMERCIQEWRKTQGDDGPNLLVALSAQAVSMSRLGESAAALKQAEQAVERHSRRVPPDDRTLAPFLRNLALVHIDAGQDALAEPLVEKALRVKELAYGPDHDSLATLLDLLAGVEYRLGKHAEAMEHALRGEGIARAIFRDVTTVHSERQAYGYEASHASGMRYVLSILSRPDAPRSAGQVERAWDDVVRSRALVLDEIASRARAASELKAPEIAALARELQAAKSSLAALALPGKDPGPEARAGALAEAQAAKERLERDLAGRSVEFRRGLARHETGLSAVRSALPPGTALLAYIQFDRFADTGPPRVSAPNYAAFLVTPSSPDPLFFPLGPADEIDALIHAWRNEAARALSRHERLMGGAERTYRKAGLLLRERVWDPISPRLRGVKTVFIVPDGSLNLVNLATLPTEEDRYLVETGPLLHHLSTERDIVRRAAQRYAQDGALLLGAPDLDARPGTAVAGDGASRDTVVASSSVSSPMVLRSGSSPEPACEDFRSVRFGPLPASRAEINEVASLVSARFRAVELTGPEATEAAFKKLAPGRRLLHIATHGFFLQDRCPSALASARAQGTGEMLAENPVLRGSADNPLLLSGLTLAGANRRGERRGGGQGGEDGMLTAEEVSALDLSGTEWAVLSACETGIGKVRPGEGVLGLRRAFAVAGAGTLIMSLWRVEDEATRHWMKVLYEGRLGGRSTAEAVREAALTLIRESRAKGLSAHPFFWGGFVAEGDWR